METVNVVLDNIDIFLNAVLAVIVAASVVVAGTRTPDPTTVIGKVYKIIELLALNFGKAKDPGPQKPQS